MITIQKLVFLLSDFHYNEFSKHLTDIKAELPRNLISIIRKSHECDDTDKLCKLVYGDCKEKNKKNFLQLTHYTFKLSSFLSRNYPNYLKYNLPLIEELLSNSNKDKANQIAEWLYDVAEKIEDYTTLIEVCKFFSQQGFLLESKDIHKLHLKVNEFYHYPHIIELRGQRCYLS